MVTLKQLLHAAVKQALELHEYDFAAYVRERLGHKPDKIWLAGMTWHEKNKHFLHASIYAKNLGMDGKARRFSILHLKSLKKQKHWFWAGDIASSLGMHKEAKILYKKALKSFIKNKSYEPAARVAEKLSLPGMVIKFHRLALGQYIKENKFNFPAQEAEALGMHYLANKLRRKALGQAVKNKDYWLAAQIAKRLGHEKQAKFYYNRYVRAALKSSDFRDLASAADVCLENLGNPKKALVIYSKALSKTPQNMYIAGAAEIALKLYIHAPDRLAKFLKIVKI